MLNRLLNIDRTYSIGLDLGASAVKMVQITRDGHGLTVNAAAAEYIDVSPNDDEAAIKVKTTAAIKKCHKSIDARFRTKYAVCGVSGPEVATRSFNLESVAPERLEAAVMAEAADVCPFNVRQNRFDFQLAAPGTIPTTRTANVQSGEMGIMVAATNLVVSKKKNTVENAGLICAMIDVNGLAMANVFNECERLPVGKTIVLLNIRNGWINMVIMSDSTLPFVRDFKHGGESIVTIIGEECALTVDTVRSVLNKSNRNPDMQYAVAQGMKPACSRVAKDITETIRYHLTQEKTGPVESVYVSGGFALADGFVDTLGSLLNLPVRIWNPFKKLKLAPKGLEWLEERGPAFVVAAGLGMRSL
jgi:type IV pilus assembly protein PilM